MNLVFKPTAWEHFQYWIENDRAMARKINGLIKECLLHPYEGKGQPEPLKANYTGHWSRRMDRAHRLVYRVEGESVMVVQCRYHY